MKRPDAEPRKRSKVVVALVVLASLLSLLLLLPALFWTANLIKCGHRPIETSDFAAANSYTLPGDGTYTYYPVLSGYACELGEVSGRQHDTLQ